MQDRARNHTFEDWEKLGNILSSRNDISSSLLISPWLVDRDFKEALLAVISIQYNQIEQLRTEVIDLRQEVESLQHQVYQND
jgi:hypothetical protein